MYLVSMDVSFWRRKSKKLGKCTLYCRITVGGEQMDICSTGIEIWKDHWDGKKISKKEPQAQFWNEQLDIMSNHVRAIYNDLLRKKEKITAAKIKRLFVGQTSNVTILSAFELYLKDSEVDQERDLDPETVKVYDRVRKKLVDFLISEKALDLLLEDFDINWIKKFRNWMKTVQVNANQIGHADSYIIKQAQTIKNVLIWAKLKKLADINPLEGIKFKGPVWDDPVFLSDEQFEKLRTHKFKKSYVQETADVFIILCRTGFHYGDLKDFVKKYTTALRKGVDGEFWVMKERIKTDVKIHVPIFDEVTQIVDKYGGWDKLPLRPLTKFNDYLKLIAAEPKLDLPEDLSSKAGRKTFTDWCYNTLHLSTDAVKVVLGRKSASGLDVYGRPDERRVAAELKQSKEMQKRKKKK
jgi:integrase